MNETVKELTQIINETATVNKRTASGILAFLQYTWLAFAIICALNGRWDYLVLSLVSLFWGAFVSDSIFIKQTGLILPTFLDIMSKTEGIVPILTMFLIDRFDRNPVLSRDNEKEVMSDENSA